MSDIILEELYPSALDAGIPVSSFWEYSVAEINDLLASHRRTAERQYKERVRHGFDLAQMIENIVARAFDSKAKKLYPWDLYPEMFKEERKAFEIEKAYEDMETFKERRRAAMDRYNANRKGAAE